MAVLLQRGQIVRIIPSLPTIKRLAADAEVAAGVSHIVATTIEIHPSQPNPSSTAQLHPDPSQSTRPRRIPFRICILTLYSSVTNHSEREHSANDLEESGQPSAVSRQQSGR